jgi:hypothetical protein
VKLSCAELTSQNTLSYWQVILLLEVLVWTTYFTEKPPSSTKNNLYHYSIVYIGTWKLIPELHSKHPDAK